MADAEANLLCFEPAWAYAAEPPDWGTAWANAAEPPDWGTDWAQNFAPNFLKPPH